MASEPGYPITMHHPAHVAAVPSVGDAHFVRPGAPERFPPFEVHSRDQEEKLRAQGYLRYGESLPVRETNPLEFPKMMSHPDHVDDIPATKDWALRDGQVVVVPVAAVPGKYPHKIANDPAEQEALEAQGYEPAGKWDEDAYEKALVAPGVPGDEYPRWEEQEDGTMKLVQDPNKREIDLDEYPKWIHFNDNTSKLANSAAEEASIKAAWHARGSSKNEPVKKAEPVESSVDPDYAEFLEWKAWKRSQLERTKHAAEPESAVPADDPDAERKALLQLAEEAGIEVDRRWGVRRLTEAIEAHQG